MSLAAPANAAYAEVFIGHVQINNPPLGGAVFWDDLLLSAAVVPTESTWIATGSGGWLSGSNWQSGNVPNAVGAVDWIDSGRFAAPYVAGENMPYLETFSSRGDIPILFDTAGNRLSAPQWRSTVDFSAADGGNNTFFGSDLGQKNNPTPVEGFRQMIGLLLDLGYDKADIRKMVATNAADFIGDAG